MSWRFVRRRNFFSLSRQRSLLRKETASRSSARLIPLRPRSGEPAANHCPPPTSQADWSLSHSWLLGQYEESFPRNLTRQGQTVQTFLPASNTLSSLSSVTSAQQVSVCSKRPSSISFNVAVGRRIRPSPPTTCSFFARMIGDTFGSLSQPTGPVQATFKSSTLVPVDSLILNKDAKGFPSWWIKPPPDLLEELPSLLLKGAIEVVSQSDLEQGFFSHYFLVPKRDGGLRPILDLRHLNLSL